MLLSDLSANKAGIEKPVESDSPDAALLLQQQEKLQAWLFLPHTKQLFDALEKMAAEAQTQAENLAASDNRVDNQIRALLVKSKTLKEIIEYGRTNHD